MRPSNPHEWAMRAEPAPELWVREGDAVVNNPQESKVGIGTTDPQTALQVVGTVSATRVLGVDYPDIINRPPMPVQSDWTNADPTSLAYILNKPIIVDPVQSDWTNADPTSLAYILNKPIIVDPVQTDWTETDPTSLSYLKNRPEWLTREDINMVYSIIGAIAAFWLALAGIAAFSGAIQSFFRRLFSDPDGDDGDDGDPADPYNDAFENQIVRIMRRHLNPEFASCVNELDYESMRALNYPNSDRSRVFVNWTDSIFGNPIARPCGTPILGIKRDLVLNGQTKIYKAPEEAYTEDEITQVVSLDTSATRDPVIDLRTNTFYINTIVGGSTEQSQEQFFSTATASIRTIDAYDFQAGKPGALLRWPTYEQRAKLDQEYILAKYDMRQISSSPAAQNAAILSVRNTDGSSFDYQKPVIDYKGQYLGSIYPSQLVSTEAVNARVQRDGLLLQQRRAPAFEIFPVATEDELAATRQAEEEFKKQRDELLAPIVESYLHSGHGFVASTSTAGEMGTPMLKRLPLGPGAEQGLFDRRRLLNLTEEDRAIVANPREFKYRRRRYEEQQRGKDLLSIYTGGAKQRQRRPPPPPPQPIPQGDFAKLDSLGFFASGFVNLTPGVAEDENVPDPFAPVPPITVNPEVPPIPLEDQWDYNEPTYTYADAFYQENYYGGGSGNPFG